MRVGSVRGGREGDRACDLNVMPFVGQREEVSEGGGSCFVMSAPPS